MLEHDLSIGYSRGTYNELHMPVITKSSEESLCILLFTRRHEDTSRCPCSYRSLIDTKKQLEKNLAGKMATRTLLIASLFLGFINSEVKAKVTTVHVTSDPVSFGDGSALRPFGRIHDASQHVRALRAGGTCNAIVVPNCSMWRSGRW